MDWGTEIFLPWVPGYLNFWQFAAKHHSSNKMANEKFVTTLHLYYTWACRIWIRNYCVTMEDVKLLTRNLHACLQEVTSSPVIVTRVDWFTNHLMSRASSSTAVRITSRSVISEMLFFRPWSTLNNLTKLFSGERNT